MRKSALTAFHQAGFRAFSQLEGFKEQIGSKVIKAMQRQNDGVTYAAMDMLCTLMQPMHDGYDLAQEKSNKAALLSSKWVVSSDELSPCFLLTAAFSSSVLW